MRGSGGKRRSLTLCGALVLLTAGGCGGGSGGPGGVAWAPTATTDDAATISGGPAGMCNGGTLLRKKVPLTLNGGDTEFAIGDGYLFTEADVPQYAYLAVPVTNLGTTMHCFVAITPSTYQWNTAQGNPPVELMTPYATGSVGDVGSGIYTSSCLAPGETGFILDIEHSTDDSDLFTPTLGITMALESSFDGTPPAAALVPQSYTDTSGTLTVSFQNVGTGAANIDASGPYLLLDSGGLPTTFGYLAETPTGLVDVGQQGTATAADPIKCGQTVRAYIVFDSPDAAFAPAGASSSLGAATRSEGAWRRGVQATLSALRRAHRTR